MTIKLTTETEQALLEAIEVTQGKEGLTITDGPMISAARLSGFNRTRLVNYFVQAVCNAVVRDGHLKWPLEVEQRHETWDEMRIRTALDEVAP